MAGRRAAACLLALAVLAGPAAAQQRPFLYLDEEGILTGSVAGKALLAEEDAARDALRAEARRIEAAFEAEERELTEKRAEMKADEFRKLADAFDARVVEARRQQDERAATLAQEFDQKRRQFYAEVGPILVGLMERRGAFAIIDESSVLLADQSINVTDEVIAEIDRAATPAPGAEVAPGAAGSGPEAPAVVAPGGAGPGVPGVGGSGDDGTAVDGTGGGGSGLAGPAPRAAGPTGRGLGPRPRPATE